MPVELGDYVRDFDAVVANLRTRQAAGQSIAVLDDADTVLYLAAGAPPWWRHSPCFPLILKRSQLTELVRAVAERGPQWVVILNNDLHARMSNEEDVWLAVHQSVESHYRLDATIGAFEIWQRNRKADR